MKYPRQCSKTSSGSRNRLRRATGLTALPEDTQAEALQKSLLLSASIMFIPAGAVWGSIYLWFGEPRAAMIPLGYSLFSLLSLIYFTFTRRFQVYRAAQLLLILICPFMLMLALGSFSSSSAVILWSVISPFGAILFADLRQAPRWLMLYAILLLAAGFLQPMLRPENNLPPALVTFFFILNIGVVSAIAFVLIFNFVRSKNEALDLLSLEREKSERLLLNVLPKEIAGILKERDGTIAEQYESASVLFADIVGFTRLSTEMSPREMVELLNKIFSYFDGLVEKYGLEKIRTIGDNYMVASGVPVPRPDHASALARMALEMMAHVRDDPECRRRGIQFRAGMNSGPLVAGVLGKHKFHYDIWGDTVNTASRMESSSAPGKIQITGAMRQLLNGEFICTPRGKVLVKDKGEMETWFLDG